MTLPVTQRTIGARVGAFLTIMVYVYTGGILTPSLIVRCVKASYQVGTIVINNNVLFTQSNILFILSIQGYRSLWVSSLCRKWLFIFNCRHLNGYKIIAEDRGLLLTVFPLIIENIESKWKLIFSGVSFSIR